MGNGRCLDVFSGDFDPSFLFSVCYIHFQPSEKLIPIYKGGDFPLFPYQASQTSL